MSRLFALKEEMIEPLLWWYNIWLKETQRSTFPDSPQNAFSMQQEH